MPTAARVVPAAQHPASTAPRAVPVAATTAPSPCEGSDRVWRIAKPGAIGGLVGAGLGAAGGAIADGGSGAGKGAVSGGLIGAAAGAGYGAYQTRNDCGTILGNGSTDRQHANRPEPDTTLRPRTVNDDITVYSAR